MKSRHTGESNSGSEKAAGPIGGELQASRWSVASRAAYRFGLVYITLFGLATQISGSLFILPWASYRGLGAFWPMRQITTWILANVFGVTAVPVFTVENGETVFFWVQTLWLLAFSLIVAAAWSALDRDRERSERLQDWLRVFLRLGLAAQMFEYGLTKIIPVQFEAPSLNILVTPVGNLSLNTLLWTSIGASGSYQIFLGCVELLAGILLIVPRTALAGALIALAATMQVFIFNMTYDIGLKLISFHLVLLAGVLLAPYVPMLAKVFLLGRAADPPREPRLFKTAGANRAALLVQLLLGIYLIGIYTAANYAFWQAEGGGRPRSPFYGIWAVGELAIDGEVRPVELNDYDRRWRRVIFDVPQSVTFQRTDDSFARYGVSIDSYANTLALTKSGSRIWNARFSFQRPNEDQLILDGEMDGHTIHLELERIPFDTFQLLNSRFRWIRTPES